jgi:hypothetical protein
MMVGQKMHRPRKSLIFPIISGIGEYRKKNFLMARIMQISIADKKIIANDRREFNGKTSLAEKEAAKLSVSKH